MSDIDPLILDLVEWVAARPRPYDEVMTAWRTSCPRLPVWEDAVDRSFLRRVSRPGGAIVSVSETGLDFLGRHGRAAAAPATETCAAIRG